MTCVLCGKVISFGRVTAFKGYANLEIDAHKKCIKKFLDIKPNLSFSDNLELFSFRKDVGNEIKKVEGKK